MHKHHRRKGPLTALCHMQMREENAKRQHDNAAQQLRTCTDHRCTMDALLNPDGVPPEFLNGTDNSEAASLAQQPWYRVLYIAQVTCQALAPPQFFFNIAADLHKFVQFTV